MTVDDVTKLDCIKRELALRCAVYPKWVALNKMTQADANREIAVMEAIANDYQERLGGDLFSEKPPENGPQSE